MKYNKLIIGLIISLLISSLFTIPTPIYADPCGDICPNGTQCTYVGDTYGEPIYKCVSLVSNPDFNIPDYFDQYGTERIPYVKNIGLGTITLAGIGRLFSAALPYFLAIASFALFFYLLFGVYQIILGMGNPQKIAQGGKIITHALIGFALIISSYLIMQAIELMLGIRILGGPIGGPTPPPTPTPTP